MKTTPAADNRTPLILLTGFLGSGKTTLLNALVQQPLAARTLLIINEFGAIGVDHLLVTRSTDDAVLELSGGCLCCTIRQDLLKTLKDIRWRFARAGQRQFDRVVIETTGLADPVPIIHSLLNNALINQQYRLDSIITTVDLATGASMLDTYPESVKQAAMADIILMSKADITPVQNIAVLQARLKNINPAATQHLISQGQIDAALLLGAETFNLPTKTADVQNWLKTEAYTMNKTKNTSYNYAHTRQAASNQSHHDDHIHSFCLSIDEPLNGQLLWQWFDTIMALYGQGILRIKGILNIAGNELPMVVHAVQHIFHPPLQLERWPENNRRSKLVFITRDIDESIIDQSFKRFITNNTSANK